MGIPSPFADTTLISEFNNPGAIDMKPGLLAALIILFVVLQIWQRRTESSTSPDSQSSPKWILKWSDEFNGLNGAPPDESKWVVDTGGNGWGNNELQYYTPRRKNVRQENDNLIIEAIKEDFTGPDGVRRDYTSARVNTAGRFSQQNGRFEARIKIPRGQGIWSAFWLLGNDLPAKGWPSCGEIDIMENLGFEPSRIFGALHGPGYSARNALTSSYTLSNGRFSDDFHVFAVEWEPQRIRFYVDDQLYATRVSSDVPPGNAWVYDHPFSLIVNVAVGGDLPGKPDDSTVFPQRMLVDYVRVYARQ